MSKQKQNLQLEEAYVAITNALKTPKLLATLSRYSYDEAKLHEGLTRHTTVKQLTQQRQQATQTALETSQLLQKSKAQLIKLFQMHRDTARLAYKREHGYTDYLKLTQRRKVATVDMLAQAETFYNSIPVPMMEKYRISHKELNETAQLVGRVRELQAMQRQMQGQVQTLTQARLQALEELQMWMRRFMTVASIALEEQPQQLEILNQTVPS